MAPYGRLLNSDEQDQGRRGSSGFLGSRTEQFTLGSLFYLIDYDFEFYGDRPLTEARKEHGRKVVDLPQNMESPKLDSDPIIDDIIIKCWHNRYATLKELAAYTECRTKEATSQKKLIAKYRIAIAMASVNKAQQRIFLSKRDPAKTWTGASSYAFFGRARETWIQYRVV
jgi:hypothetical protein